MPPTLPHLVLFNPDSFRAGVLGHLGDKSGATPNLDALVADSAVSFQNAFCQNPVCTPSRCSFMSGWYPHVRGHRTMHHMMQPHEPVLLRDLKEMGYFVWWGGKNDLVPAQHGYDAYCSLKYQPPNTPDRPLWTDLHAWDDWRRDPDGEDYYSFYYGRIETPVGEDYLYDYDWAMIEGALEFIRNPPSDQPLCLYLPLVYPHPPFAVEDPWYSQVDRTQLPPRIPTPQYWDLLPSIMGGIYKRQGLHGWTEGRWEELLAAYYGMCARVDAQFGLLVEALKENGLYNDTAIFFFSDHGEFAGDYGLVEKTQNTFQDCLTRVPFVIKPPRGISCLPGARDALVELVDLRATVEALTCFEPGCTHFGRSLLPLISGETDHGRDAVFCEGGRLMDETHCMELESTSSQVPSGLYWPRVGLQSGAGPEHGKAVMCRTRDFKYVRRLYEEDELYDLIEDPHETENLIKDPGYAVVLSGLMDRLLSHFLETGDVVPHQPDRRS